MPRNEVNSSSSNNPSMRHLNHNKMNEKIVCVIREVLQQQQKSNKLLKLL